MVKNVYQVWSRGEIKYSKWLNRWVEPHLFVDVASPLYYVKIIMISRLLTKNSLIRGTFNELSVVNDNCDI